VGTVTGAVIDLVRAYSSHLHCNTLDCGRDENDNVRDKCMIMKLFTRTFLVFTLNLADVHG
jgi:hypothetical protein